MLGVVVEAGLEEAAGTALPDEQLDPVTVCFLWLGEIINLTLMVLLP